MSDMPPEFYVPAFTAMGSVILALGGCVKYLYGRQEKRLEVYEANQAARTEKFETLAIEVTKTVALNTVAIGASTDAIARLAATQHPNAAARASRNAGT